MSNGGGGTTSMPSWQSQQRQGGAYSSQSPPPSSYRSGGAGSSSGDYPQPQSFNQSRFRASASGTGSPSGSMQGRTLDRSNSYLSGGGGSQRSGNEPSGAVNKHAFPQQAGLGSPQEDPMQDPGSQQQVHRRTQSLRPMSAFQPLDNVDGPYATSPGGQRPSSPTGSTTRSIRTAAAPLTFKSPELRSALSLQDAQSRKIYMEGYLSKRDHLTPDAKPLAPTDPKKRWQLCFVQLSGTVLSVWNVHQMEEAARLGTEVPPSYINVTDCFVDFVGTITESPQEVPGSRGRYENVFAVNTAGQNRVLFGVEGSVGRRLVQAWVNGIRLATWEKLRLEEIYTGSLVRARLGAVSAQQATSGPGGAPGDVEMSIKSPLNKNGRMEGWVKARFMGSTEWRKCWLVLTNKGAEQAGGSGASNDQKSDTSSVTSPRSSFWSKLKAGDRGSLIGSPSMPAVHDTGVRDIEVPPGANGASGLACFYEGKKAKKPFATLAYAAHAFAVYPSRPELVEGSSLFKVEGAFPLSGVVSATNRLRQTGWVMIMPELETGSNKGANAEMMKWCIAFMDAFKLYGRPAQFQWDARNPLSPFFAYPIGPYKDRLFLDRELSEFLDIREERHLANRFNLHGIMAARMRGERTPILPPLPQPNTESTRGLNGQQQQQQQQQQRLSRAELPPLNIGSLDDEPDVPAPRGTQLSSIGERSREGSVMTNFTQTPVNAVAAETALSNGRRPDQAGFNADLAARPESSQASSVVGTTTVATTGRTRAFDSTDSSVVGTDPSKPSPAAASELRAAAPLSAAAAQEPQSIRPPVAKRNDSDNNAANFDEGVLYYLNSMGDSLPSVSPKVGGARELPATGQAATVNQAGQISTDSSERKATGVHATPNLEGDARAAYSFLSQPVSPAAPAMTGTEDVVQQRQEPVPTAVSYPSSFNSNKSQERKLAAQAQADAYSQAINTPGRPGGAAVKTQRSGGRRTWGDEEGDEEEGEEEEESEDVIQERMRVQQQQQQGRAPLPNTPSSQALYASGGIGNRQQQAQSYGQQGRPAAAYSSHLAAAANNASSSRGSSPGSVPRSSTLVQLSREEQPGAVSMAFQPQGLVQAGQQDKAERSAKYIEADARATGSHLVNVAADGKQAAPQSGLMGAISAHERERRKEGGIGATLTERERERKQREEEAMRFQQMQQQQMQQMMTASQSGAGGWPATSAPMAFNPMMWQQMQMMMMNPMMYGGMHPGMNPQATGGAAGSQSGHGHGNSPFDAQQQAAQMRAAQAAQQAYMQALQQQQPAVHPGGGSGTHGAAGGTGSESNMTTSPSLMNMSLPGGAGGGMMPAFNPYMSMYGAPMGFPAWGTPGFGAPPAGPEGGQSGSAVVTPQPQGGNGYASPEPSRQR